MKKVLNCNTHIGVDLKTMLRKDRKAKTGKNYVGCAASRCIVRGVSV